MAGFIPSIAINTILTAGATAVNLTLFKTCAKDKTNLKEMEKAKLVAEPILITLSIVLGSLLIGLLLSKLPIAIMVSQTIDLLFVTSFLSAYFSIISSFAIYASIEFKELNLGYES